MSERMKALVVEKRGGVENLVAKEVEKPGQPQGDDLLVKIHACSVNPVDLKVRAGTYDDYPDYYSHIPSSPYQILGFDGAGTITAVGPSVHSFKPGDEVFYTGSPFRHGSNAEYQLVAAGSVAKKPKNLSWEQAAALPLTYITAYEALVERMEIKKGEKAGLVIVNGAGGVGSIATQIARKILNLPIVIATASRPETVSFSKRMGATHTISHREDLPSQITDLKLDPSIPIKYVFITHSTDPYLGPAAAICAPFGKVCSIVQTKNMNLMYGTEFMAKSLVFVWELLGTKPYYGVEKESHGRILEELRGLVEEGVIESHLMKTVRLNLKGLRDAHGTIEEGGSIGKVALGIDVQGEGELWV